MKILFHPFEAGVLDGPYGDQRVLVLGAKAGFAVPPGFGGRLSLVQGFRPDFNALATAGHDVSPEPAGEGFDAALVLCGRHRGLNELRLADALERSRPGALIVVAGGKDDGIASLRKRVGAIVPLDGSMSKYHGMAFWLSRPTEAGPAMEALRAGNGPVVVDGRFFAAPGMFSHDRMDQGSRLLCEALSGDIAGRVADFCAGWGYLAVGIAERCPKARSIDLYEADHASLQAARRNMAALAPAAAARFFWHDLAGEPVAGRYDAVVMNPPFHTGRAAEPQIGQALIRVAAKSIKPGGQLLMVANRQLPYEAVLSESFRSVDKLREEAGFKVFRARH